MGRILMILLCFLVISLTVPAQNPGGNWMQGNWEGTGYQISSNDTWTVKLNVSGGRFLVEYPSLKCGGEWKIVSMNLEMATFKERITYGKKICQDDGNVVVERLNDTQIGFRWSFPDMLEVDASAILKRSEK